MSDVAGVKQALSQTQALERVQEASRRQGDTRQQAFAASLNGQVDAEEHQVSEGEHVWDEPVDADQEQEKDGQPETGDQTGKEAPAVEAGPESDEPGQRIDVRA